MVSTTSAQFASQLHEEAVIIDGLNSSNWTSGVLQRMNAGGLTAANCTIALHENFRETISAIATWDALFRDHAETIRPVRTVGDIYAAKSEGRTGIILGFQNASPFEDDLTTIRIFYQLGVRVVQLTYNARNLLGDGCYERDDGGLSTFGIDVIREMNRVGMLIDLSHVGFRTTLDAIETSAEPCSFDHVASHALHPDPRNKTDEQMRALAEKGGVIGIVAFPPFLKATLPVTLDDYFRHLDYVVELVGVDHVALGPDLTEDQTPAYYDWCQYGRGWTAVYDRDDIAQNEAFIPEISSVDRFPTFTAELLRRGYGSDDVVKIMGGNWLRLFEKVWQ